MLIQMSMIPHFKIKNNFQKRKETYSDILTNDILVDICKKTTGQNKFTVEFDKSGYNKGRLVTIEHNNKVIFLSLSETEIASRNSPLQSFPSALNSFFLEKKKEKKIFFYFLPTTGSSFETNYFMFMYRLMKTIGVEFLNHDKFLTMKIKKFKNIEDLIHQRNLNSGRNRRNKSTYVTINSNSEIEIYGKTYGANKYETTLLSYALRQLTNKKIIIRQISEGNLKKLPSRSIEVMKINKIELDNSDLLLEPDEVLIDSKLRTPAYIYNLFKKLGDKKCSFCDCIKPEEIAGAHIWPVAEIRKIKDLHVTIQMEYAKDGENGIWLCNLHHLLFDSHKFIISTNGNVKFKSVIKDEFLTKIKSKITNYKLHKDILTNKFIFYLEKRNKLIVESEYFDF